MKYFIDSSKNIKVFFLRINSNKLIIKSKLQSFLNLQSFVKMTSYCLIPNLVLNLWANVALQFIITLISNFFSLKILLTYFIGFSTSSYLCFLWPEWYLIVISCKFYDLILLLCSFNQNIPSLSTVVSIPFLTSIFLLVSTIFIERIPQKFQECFFLLLFHYILLTHLLLKQIFHD